MHRGVAAPRVLVVGCGALGRELVALTANLPNVEIACLPPDLQGEAHVVARVAERARVVFGAFGKVEVDTTGPAASAA